MEPRRGQREERRVKRKERRRRRSGRTAADQWQGISRAVEEQPWQGNGRATEEQLWQVSRAVTEQMHVSFKALVASCEWHALLNTPELLHKRDTWECQ